MKIRLILFAVLGFSTAAQAELPSSGESWINPQSGYEFAREAIERAYKNPAVLNNRYAQAIARVRELMPFQNFEVVVGTPLERYCFGKSLVTGNPTEFAGFAMISQCTQTFSGARELPKVCTIGICKPGMLQDMEQFAHTLIHEMGHVIQGTDECFASAVAMNAMRLAGYSGRRDGYTTACGLDHLIGK
jgi:hypothetical protein